jgi:anti-anti-sigma factor
MDYEPSDALVERHALGHVEILTVRAAEVYEAQAIQGIAREVRAAFRDSAVTAFILDLGPVRFLTSGALGMLIHLRSQLAEQGRTLALAGAAGEVARVLACTRLSEVMPVFETVEAAVREIRCPPASPDCPRGG